MSFRIGVDVGGTSIRLRRFPGGESDRLEAPTGALGGPAVTERIVDLVGAMLAAGGRPDGIGVGIPGQVDPGAGTVRHAVNLGIDGAPYPLGVELGDRLGVPVTIENDVRAAALGAYHHLRDLRPGLATLVYLSAGTGVSAGVVIDGRLHRGRHGIAGEIGHAPLGDPNVTCSCGLAGCLEAVAGGRSLDERLRGSARTLFDDPSPDPHTAGRVASALARALYVLAATYDPDLFVLGGGIGTDAAPAVRKALTGISAASPFGEVVLTPDRVTTLPPDADVGTAGAALLGGRRHPSAPGHTRSASSGLDQGGTRK